MEILMEAVEAAKEKHLEDFGEIEAVVIHAFGGGGVTAVINGAASPKQLCEELLDTALKVAENFREKETNDD